MGTVFTLILAIILGVIYFGFFIFVIYSIIKMIQLLSKSIYSGKINDWADHGNGLVKLSNSVSLSQHYGVASLGALPSLGFAFLIYLIIWMIPDYFDRAEGLKIIHDLFIAGFVGIGFSRYLNSKKISGSILTEVGLGRTADLYNIECDILLQVILKKLDVDTEETINYNREDIEEIRKDVEDRERQVKKVLDWLNTKAIIEDMEKKAEGDQNLQSLIFASRDQLKERINSSWNK